MLQIGWGLVRQYTCLSKKSRHSPVGNFQSLNSRFEIICACALLYTAKKHIHTLMSSPDTCTGIRIHVSIRGGMEILYLD